MSGDEASDVARVAEGDRAAFARLVQQHLAPVEAYALRICGNPATAQDVAQEVMLKLWMQAGRYDPSKARLTTWLHQIAHNQCIDSLRANQRLTSVEDSPGATTSQAVADTVPEEDRELAAALAALPERQRNALVLTYYQDLSNREVAEVMGLGTRAVESLLVRARASLRKRLEVVA